MMKFHLGSLTITSPVFAHGGRIPERFSTDGEGISPELVFTNVPSGTQELALVCHDPDAPMTYGFTHWVLYGISADTKGIPEGGGSEFTQGVNELGNPGWIPPAPPPGHGDHFYYFHLFALDAKLDLQPGLDRAGLLAAIDDHITEQARLVGVYSRS
jgi:Raf kinase inhibitor-like YbhB/YbcL family protein